jgi:hypothetical protein
MFVLWRKKKFWNFFKHLKIIIIIIIIVKAAKVTYYIVHADRYIHKWSWMPHTQAKQSLSNAFWIKSHVSLLSKTNKISCTPFSLIFSKLGDCPLKRFIKKFELPCLMCYAHCAPHTHHPSNRLISFLSWSFSTFFLFIHSITHSTSLIWTLNPNPYNKHSHCLTLDHFNR